MKTEILMILLNIIKNKRENCINRPLCKGKGIERRSPSTCREISLLQILRKIINAGETKYMVMSRDQSAGRSHNIMTDNNSFERVERIKYLGGNLTYQNSIQD